MFNRVNAVEANAIPLDKGLVKKYNNNNNNTYIALIRMRSSIEGVSRSREGVGHEVLSLVQGMGRAIFSYP